jgi:hypothetical protein
MISGFYLRAAALAAAVSLWASPATAQITDLNQLSEAQETEIYCVSDKLSASGDAFEAVAEAFLYNDNSPEQIKQAETALKTASNVCAVAYKWDAGKRALGEKIGVYISAGEYLVEELYFEGMEDEEIDLIFAALGKLPTEDQDRFLDDSWLEDAGFTKRLDAALVAAKYPGDDDYILESARLIMEVTMLTSAGTSDWVRLYINKQ